VLHICAICDLDGQLNLAYPISYEVVHSLLRL